MSTNFKEDAIKAVKSMNISKEELGFKPTIIETVDNDFLDGITELLVDYDISPEIARKYIPESYWDYMNIEDKRYKIVELNLKKCIYTTVSVAVPQGTRDFEIIESEYDLENVVVWNKYDVDEDDWEIEGVCNIIEDNLTASSVRQSHNYVINSEVFDED